MGSPEKTYRSDALRSAYLIAQGLHAAGAIDKATMRRFDVSCLKPAGQGMAQKRS